MASESSTNQFEWPALYSYPPFYTLQTNLDTRAKQIDAWCSLILNYFRHNKLYIFDVTEILTSSELFNNSKLKRALSRETATVMLNTLETRGNLGGRIRRRHVVSSCGAPLRSGGTGLPMGDRKRVHEHVCTIFELHSGEDTVNEEFYGLDLVMVVKALQTLQNEGKAQIIPRSNPDLSDAGVKFFG